MRVFLLRLSLACGIALAGCYQMPKASESPVVGGTRVGSSLPSEASVLYARDGSPVRDLAPGALQTLPTSASRELGSEEGGSRLYLLELYQDAIEQKEELTLENRRHAAALSTAAERERELEERVQTLEDENSTLQDFAAQFERTNVELAERLTTAQIRRLEAEKMLLEATLEWNRALPSGVDGSAILEDPR